MRYFIKIQHKESFTKYLDANIKFHVYVENVEAASSDKALQWNPSTCIPDTLGIA